MKLLCDYDHHHVKKFPLLKLNLIKKNLLALSIHTFHGNGFVRSVDLLVLPNINPDAAYGMQVSIEDSLAQYKSVTFQIALLYTSSKGERRIRVHTLSLPVSGNLNEICANADQEAIVSLIGKMGKVFYIHFLNF